MQKGNDSSKSMEKEKLYLFLEQVMPPSRAFNSSVMNFLKILRQVDLLDHVILKKIWFEPWISQKNFFLILITVNMYFQAFICNVDQWCLHGK